MRRTLSSVSFPTFWILCIAVALLAHASAQAAEGLTPHFFVEGTGDVDEFPLLRTEARATIAGMIAEVELTQTYKNDGDRTIEAIYVFPLGSKAAIHAMRMHIGDRVLEARIEEREAAQQIFDEAKEEGKTATLLEQQRPNIFQMSVANILPGDIVDVVVGYTETLVPEEGVYAFVFPAVVGPRYTGEAGDATPIGEGIPYLHQGREPTYAFDMHVNLRTGSPLADIWATSHGVQITRTGDDQAEVALAAEDVAGGNRDFILQYSLQGGAIESGLLLYPGAREKFFLLMLEPPAPGAAPAAPPREYVFIVDVSGSMNGFPLTVSKDLISNIILGLRPDDVFNILFFAGASTTLFPQSLPATADNVNAAMTLLDEQAGGGGTNLLSALQHALSLEKAAGFSRTVVIATDGYVNVEKQAFDLIAQGAGDANVFAFGIGSSVNRYLIEGLARAGSGEPFIVTDIAEGEPAAARFARYVEHPLLIDIDVAMDGLGAYDVEPPSLPDLFAERPLVLFGKYAAPGNYSATGAAGMKGFPSKAS